MFCEAFKMDIKLVRILLIKEALDYRYLNYKYYLEQYDEYAYKLINKKSKLNELLLQYINEYSNDKVLKYLDIPEIRYLLLDGFHDSSIFKVDYSSNILDIYLDNKGSLSWPDNIKNKMIMRFYGVYDINLTRIPKWWVEHELSIKEDNLSLSIRADKKEVTFTFSKVEFKDV